MKYFIHGFVGAIAFAFTSGVLAVDQQLDRDTSDGSLESRQRDLLESRIVGGTQAVQGEFPFFGTVSQCMRFVHSDCYSRVPMTHNIVQVGMSVDRFIRVCHTLRYPRPCLNSLFYLLSHQSNGAGAERR